MRSWMLAIVTWLAGTSTATAASDGALGRTSTASVNVSITIGSLTMISGLRDLEMPKWTRGEGDVLAGTNACVYTNSSTAGYFVTVSSAHAGGSGLFRMADGSGNYLSYQLAWSDTADTHAAAVACGSGSSHCSLSGIRSASQRNANTSATNCGLGSNAAMSLRVLAADMNRVPDGSYSDVLTLVVDPS
jgi:hypothetical protein